jgi:hypothetical protein
MRETSLEEHKTIEQEEFIVVQWEKKKLATYGFCS